MPVYEYRCEQGHSFEVTQRMADDALQSCEECGAPAERVLHSPAAAVAGATTFGSGYSAKPRRDDAGKDAAARAAAAEKKDEDGSWLDTAEQRKGPTRTFRRGLRRN